MTHTDISVSAAERQLVAEECKKLVDLCSDLLLICFTV